MTENNSSTFSLTMPSDRELVMTRVFNGPPELVFKAWTNPDHVKQWWGLRGSTLSVCEIDLRPGGAWRYVQQTADGSEYAFSGEYREIESPNRLVYTEEYEAMPGHDYLVTLNFEEQNGRTKLTTTSLYQSKEDRDGHVQSGMEAGARETYDRLDEHLEMVQANGDISDRVFVIERVFNAPRSLVFEAYSSAEHLKHWWGPKNWTLPFCEVDFRPGGTWFYCMKGPEVTNFMESWGKAVYKEIVEPERIVYMDMFVDSEGNKIPNTPEMEITVNFEEMDGKTKLITRTVFETAEELQTVIKMGMEQGITETFNRLDEYLAKLG